MPKIALLPVEAVCLSCPKSQSRTLMGSTYEGKGENGMRVKSARAIRGGGGLVMSFDGLSRRS